jgi:hypothetical protein
MTSDDGPRAMLLKLEISSRSEEEWPRLRARLVADIERALDLLVNAERGTFLVEENEERTTPLRRHAPRGTTAGEHTTEIEARIDRLFAEREYDLTKARRRNAYGSALEREHALVGLRMALLSTKALFVTDEGDEALILGQKASALFSRLRNQESPERPEEHG